ncbi:MAG: hypothetical protein EOP38_27970 [Rubrivivax sp.]|nr:MAG: hypothetical protein EOP38_27970 [Rubrivivax sp.]
MAGFSIFLLTAETVLPDASVMSAPMPGEEMPVGAPVPNGLVCSDGMETNPYNDDLMVIDAVAEGCVARQMPVHT